MSLSEVQTRYGTLKGIHKLEHYKDGSLKACTLVEPNTIRTPYGKLMPQYEDDGLRRKFTQSLTFYPSGVLKSISLQEQTKFKTSQGEIPAELVTFYENEAIHRIFPLNGKLSGFWSEKNEYEMEPILHFRLKNMQFDKKVIGVAFYQDGNVYSFTFWPQDGLTVKLPRGEGEIEARIGLTFYQNGAVKSLEPRRTTPVQTPVGEIAAYDVEALGVTGDINSLRFHEDGSIAAVTTNTNTVTVKAPDGKETTYEPLLHMSHFEDEVMRVEPLVIRFEKEKVLFAEKAYPLDGYTFSVGRFNPRNVKVSNDCEGCS